MAEDQPQDPSTADNGPDEAADPQLQEALTSAQSSLDQIKQEMKTDTGSEADPDPTPEEASENRGGIELLSDVDLDVAIELGRTEMLVEDVLKLGSGSVVELDKLAGDPVDVHVNGQLVARGEVLVLNDNFCIRISEIVADLEEQAHDARQQAQNQAQA